MLHPINGIHTDTALDVARSEHRRRIERAENHRLVAGLDTDRSVRQGRFGRLAGFAKTARPVVASVAAVMVVGSVLSTATPAEANPCESTDFAGAHSWCVSYESTSVEAAVGVAGSERPWLLRLDPADREAVLAAETDQIVARGWRVL
ncbi:MAG: hypothetical protein OEX04_12115 [Acidimicrobiia bacterium]|nr:hypothetical protein [Acidimicrobiia bacterium]MDH4308211.1 hypothetical protein [Acidimicrobiia bacterium]MDH5293062.1 hypothetical protein [Acidimicrobiia bacterium]